MSVQRRERSQPWKDQASDCGVRGAGGDRKRGANGELLEGGIGGKNCFSGETGKKKIVQKDKGGATRGLPWGSPILALLSFKHAKLRSSDGIQCVGAGIVAPVINCDLCVFDVNTAQESMATAEGPGQRLWGPRSQRRSKARGKRRVLGGAGQGKKVLQRLEGRKKNCTKGEKGCNTRTFQGVTHPSTTPAQARSTSEFGWDPGR
ncbi:Hypothetical predicted protein [Olea europaea subsp. europaea]|uniref:Uncharacterized protein n=1 Tax=Olea europaea subsp. europaea TaxID=158383 RepID=A0A8S0RRB8_OLEEU|nr:Hypothetical predicted protein [Olea europaea subsp. europaea]